MRYVYCHPLFDERKCAHRFSWQLKNIFQNHGLELERFDYTGTGEAPGRFADVTLNSLRRDIQRHIDKNPTCLIAARFGAGLAFEYCARSPDRVQKLALVEPIVDGAEYLDYLRRKQHIKNLMTTASKPPPSDNGFENIEGYKTSNRFLEQLKNFNLLETARESPIKCPVLIVKISKTPGLDTKTAAFAELLDRPPNRLRIEIFDLPQFWQRIPDADHTKLTRTILRHCHA